MIKVNLLILGVLNLQYDIFISHSSLDKDDVAIPLFTALERLGLKVWFDSDQIPLGSGIRRKIEYGIRESRFAVVIMSPDYIKSDWCQKELDAFFVREINGNEIILPIYHGLEFEDVKQYSPILANRLSLSTDENIDFIADSIKSFIDNESGKKKKFFSPKNKLHWFPSTNIQWLIGLGVAIFLGILPLYINSLEAIDNNKTIINNIYYKPNGNHVSTKNLINNVEDHKILFEEVLNNMSDSSDKDLIGKVRNYLLKREPEKAANLLRNNVTKKENEQSQSLEYLSKKWVEVGTISFLFDSDQSLKDYNKALELDRNNIDALNGVGIVQQRLDNHKEAIKAFNRILNITYEKDDSSEENKPSIALVYGNLGSSYVALGQLNDAKIAYNDALDIYRILATGISSNDDDSLYNFYRVGEANSLNNLGLLHYTNKMFDEAEEFFLEAFVIYNDLEHQAGLAWVYNNIGLNHLNSSESSDLNEAIVYFEEAKLININNNWLESLATNYGGLGLSYRKLGGIENLNQAEIYYKESLKIEEKLGKVSGVASDMGNLGYIYLDRKKIKMACDYWEKSLGLYNQINSIDAIKIQKLLENHCTDV